MRRGLLLMLCLALLPSAAGATSPPCECEEPGELVPLLPRSDWTLGPDRCLALPAYLDGCSHQISGRALHLWTGTSEGDTVTLAAALESSTTWSPLLPFVYRLGSGWRQDGSVATVCLEAEVSPGPLYLSRDIQWLGASVTLASGAGQPFEDDVAVQVLAVGPAPAQTLEVPALAPLVRRFDSDGPTRWVEVEVTAPPGLAERQLLVHLVPVDGDGAPLVDASLAGQPPEVWRAALLDFDGVQGPLRGTWISFEDWSAAAFSRARPRSSPAPRHAGPPSSRAPTSAGPHPRR